MIAVVTYIENILIQADACCKILQEDIMYVIVTYSFTIRLPLLTCAEIQWVIQSLHKCLLVNSFNVNNIARIRCLFPLFK